MTKLSYAPALTRRMIKKEIKWMLKGAKSIENLDVKRGFLLALDRLMFYLDAFR